MRHRTRSAHFSGLETTTPILIRPAAEVGSNGPVSPISSWRAERIAGRSVSMSRSRGNAEVGGPSGDSRLFGLQGQNPYGGSCRGWESMIRPDGFELGVIACGLVRVSVSAWYALGLSEIQIPDDAGVAQPASPSHDTTADPDDSKAYLDLASFDVTLWYNPPPLAVESPTPPPKPQNPKTPKPLTINIKLKYAFLSVYNTNLYHFSSLQGSFD